MTATPLIMIVSGWSKLQLGIDNKDYQRHHHYHLQHCHRGGILTRGQVTPIVCSNSEIIDWNTRSTMSI